MISEVFVLISREKSCFFWWTKSQMHSCVRCPVQLQSGWKNNSIKASNFSKPRILPTASTVHRCSAADCCSVLQDMENAERKLQLSTSAHLGNFYMLVLLCLPGGTQIKYLLPCLNGTHVWFDCDALRLFSLNRAKSMKEERPWFLTRGQRRRTMGWRGCPSRNATQPWPCNVPHYCDFCQ